MDIIINIQQNVWRFEICIIPNNVGLVANLGSGYNPARNAANISAIAVDKNHTPIIIEEYLIGDNFATKLCPVGDINISASACIILSPINVIIGIDFAPLSTMELGINKTANDNAKNNIPIPILLITEGSLFLLLNHNNIAAKIGDNIIIESGSIVWNSSGAIFGTYCSVNTVMDVDVCSKAAQKNIAMRKIKNKI